MKSTIPHILVFGLSCLNLQAQETSSLNSGSFLKKASFSKLEADFEVDGLFSSDVEVIQSLISFEQIKGAWVFSGSIGQTHHNVDVSAPPGVLGANATRREDTYRYSLGLERQISNNFSASLTVSHTDGFADHRSLWISQLNTLLENVPGFPRPNPQSSSLSFNSKWDYLPGRGSIAASLGFSQARIIPLAAIDEETFTSIANVEQVLDTYSGSLQWEYTLNPRLKTQQTLRFSRTEGREIRTQLQSDWAFSLTKNLTLRGQLGVADENPTFESIFGGLTLVWEVNDQFQIDFGGRYYEDTGEINSENFNTAAPGIESTEISIGALWKNDNTSVRISAGLYDTDFDDIENEENRPFFNLYRDRNFVTTRFAISHAF